MASSSEEAAPRRAPRKRATRKSTTKRASRSQSTAGAPVKKRAVPAPKPEILRPTDTERKAPTALAAARTDRKSRQHRLLVAGVVVALGVGASAWVGSTDPGQIDVRQVIEDRNERIRTNTTDERDVITSRVTVPVQDTDERKADGGLVGLGTGGSTPTPPPEVATTTATTSDTAATSTDAAATSTATEVSTTTPTSTEATS